MIDEEGYRANVGIILANNRGDLLWARRRGQDAWQFPQGGIQNEETPEQAMLRELQEEIGLEPADVDVLACTTGWLKYRLPAQFMRNRGNPNFVGQKQKWFLLRMLGEDARVCMDGGGRPEFDQWRWVKMHEVIDSIVPFKKPVYEQVIAAFKHLGQP